MKKSLCFYSLVLVVLLNASMVLGQTQYQVYSWDNFNEGTLPQYFNLGLSANQNNVGLVNITSANLPGGISEGIAGVECGPYSVRFETSPETPRLSLISPTILERKALGASGKALYQCDFYLSDESKKCYTMAVLAVVPPDKPGDVSYKMYRLGILNGAKLFFSYMTSDGKPLVYEMQNLSDFKLKIPGWHRVQIIFEGQDKIICAIDQKTAKFSPIVEPSLTRLQAGLMVTAYTDKPPIVGGVAYADNLSIQMTTVQNAELPDTPWNNPQAYNKTAQIQVSKGAAAQTTQSSAPKTNFQPQYGVQTSGLDWMVSPQMAWKQCQEIKKPILIMFYLPTLKKFQEIQSFIQSDAGAKSLLSNFILLGLDVNQLAGGKEAQNFNVFKVPTFVVLGSDGKEKTRILVGKNTQWSEIAAQLQTAMK